MAQLTRAPTSDFATGGTVTYSSGTVGWSLVNDYPDTADPLSSYVQLGTTANSFITFGFSAFDVPAGSTINWVEVQYYDEEPSNGANTAAARLRINGVYYQAATHNPTTTTTQRLDRWTTNPVTSSAWTVAQINGTDSNSIQHFGVIGPDSNPTWRLGAIRIVVDYTPKLNLVQSGSISASGSLTTSASLTIRLDKNLAQSGAVALSGTAAVSGDITITAAAGADGGFSSFSALWPYGLGAGLPEANGGFEGINLWPYGLGKSGNSLAFGASLVSISGSVSVSGTLGYGFSLVTSPRALSGTLAVSGNLAYVVPKLNLAQSGAVALSGALTTAANIRYTLNLSLGSVALSGTAATSGLVSFKLPVDLSFYTYPNITAEASVFGDLGITDSPKLDLQNAVIAVSGAPTVSADVTITPSEKGFRSISLWPHGFGVSTNFLNLAPSTLALSGTSAVSGTFAYQGAPFDVGSGALALSGSVAPSANLGFRWNLATSSFGLSGTTAISGDISSREVAGGFRGISLYPFGVGQVSQPVALTFSPLALNSSLGVFGDIGVPREWELAQPIDVPPLSGVLTVSGNIVTSNLPKLNLQFQALALNGTHAVTADFAYKFPWSITLDGVALSGETAVSGDILAPTEPKLDLQNASLDLPAELLVEGDLDIQEFFSLNLDPAPVGLTASVSVSGTFEYLNRRPNLSIQPIQLSSVLVVSGQIQTKGKLVFGAYPVGLNGALAVTGNITSANNPSAQLLRNSWISYTII